MVMVIELVIEVAEKRSEEWMVVIEMVNEMAASQIEH